MQNHNSIRSWSRRLPTGLAVLSSLVLLLAGAATTSVIAAGSSGGFASVTIKDRSKDEIIVATAKVFTADGYRSGRSAAGQMVFDKEASRGTSMARDGIAATQSGARTINRVRVDVIPLDSIPFRAPLGGMAQGKNRIGDSRIVSRTERRLASTQIAMVDVPLLRYTPPALEHDERRHHPSTPAVARG